MTLSHNSKFCIPTTVKYVDFHSYKYFIFQDSTAKCNSRFFSIKLMPAYLIFLYKEVLFIGQLLNLMSLFIALI